MADSWDDLTTNEKLQALRTHAKETTQAVGQLSTRLDQLQQAVTLQILPMVSQIGDLTAKVAALESAMAASKG